MPSTSAAQHRWIGYLHSNPEAAKRAGMSQAKVGEWLHADHGSPWKHAGGGIVPHYDDGGMIDPSAGQGIGGPTPAQSANPLEQNIVQRYGAYPTEKLAEMSAQLGGTQQGRLIQQLLMQRRLTPPSQDRGIVAPQAQTYAPGGTIKRDMGGVMSMGDAMPWWARREEEQASSGGSGFLHGVTSGRADQVKTQAPPGSHVLPADVMAGIGEGNGLAGARIMQSILASGPHGIPMPRGSRGMGAPRPPAAPSNMQSGGTIPIFDPKGRAGGGANIGDTPVDLSDGEFVISPADVLRFGYGDQKRGHDFWDKFIMRKRAEHIKKLKSLPGPVRGSK